MVSHLHNFLLLINEDGNILSITVTESGSGYESGANIDIIITGANTSPANAIVATYIDEIVGFVVNQAWFRIHSISEHSARDSSHRSSRRSGYHQRR